MTVRRRSVWTGTYCRRRSRSDCAAPASTSTAARVPPLTDVRERRAQRLREPLRDDRGRDDEDQHDVRGRDRDDPVEAARDLAVVRKSVFRTPTVVPPATTNAAIATPTRFSLLSSRRDLRRRFRRAAAATATRATSATSMTSPTIARPGCVRQSSVENAAALASAPGAFVQMRTAAKHKRGRSGEPQPADQPNASGDLSAFAQAAARRFSA
jgi:hypothetical protein